MDTDFNDQEQPASTFNNSTSNAATNANRSVAAPYNYVDSAINSSNMSQDLFLHQTLRTFNHQQMPAIRNNHQPPLQSTSATTFFGIDDRQSKVVEMLPNICQLVMQDLNRFGICVIDGFLDSIVKDTGDNILAEVKQLYNNGLFREGQLVSSKALPFKIRGDRITWVDGTEPFCRNIGFLMQTLDSIVKRCNTMKGNGILSQYKITRRTQAMIACYPGDGTHYVKHVDNPNQDGRCITSIYYLNKDWDCQVSGVVIALYYPI